MKVFSNEDHKASAVSAELSDRTFDRAGPKGKETV